MGWGGGVEKFDGRRGWELGRAGGLQGIVNLYR
jgi:hypothetical protein